MHTIDDSTPVRPGDVLAGKYRVERVLGMGGMGVVVAATHLDLGSRVALKFLLPAALANAVAVGRFAQEARAVVRLRSEHVARVIDVGRLESGAPYIVMEYLEGTDLGTLIEQRGALPVPEAVDYVLQACEAVAEAHAVGIIHRDLKPRNLFLTRRVDGRPLVKVLDFGISKFSGAPGSESMQHLSMTKTSDVMGSPMYMSPEQLRSSRRVDERSDVWSLGVILYELLTARVPFEAESVTELCAMLLQDAHVPVGQLRADVPPGVTATIDRCLQKDPAARFQNVAELATALEAHGSPGAKEMAERVRLVAPSVAAARASSVPEASAPLASVPGSAPPGRAPETSGSASLPVASSRVAVTGGTSVSWGETQLASKVGPLPTKRAPWLLGAAAAVVVLAAGLLWRSYAPAVGGAPLASAQGATVGAIASGTEPQATEAVATTTAAAAASARPAPTTTATTKPTTAPSRPTIVTPTAAAAATIKPASAHTAAAQATARPHASATATATSRPTPPAGAHKSDELPNERE